MNPRFQTFLKEEWLQLVLLALPLAAASFALPYARNPVPIHWNLQGTADGFVAAPWGLMLTPLLFALVLILVLFFEHRDRYRLTPDGSLSVHGRSIHTIRLAVSILFAAICALQISWSLGYPPETTKLLPSGMALLFAFIGNLFGKLKPNRYVGIRVPWTTHSENVWRKTHRLAGWLWTGGSLLFAIAIWLLPGRLLSGAALLWLTILIVIPLTIAWHEARKEKLSLP